MIEKPNLKSHQYAVGQAALATGNVLKTDKSPYLQNGEVYLIFDSKDEAENYMKRTVEEHPAIECWMENSLGEHVMTIDKDGERKLKKS